MSYASTIPFPIPPPFLGLSRPLPVHYSNARHSSLPLSVNCAFVLSMSLNFLNLMKSVILLSSGSRARLEHTSVHCVSTWGWFLVWVAICKSSGECEVERCLKMMRW